MALPHASPLEAIDLNAWPDGTRSISLLKTPGIQLMRLVLAAGQRLPEHHVPGEVVIQCVSGSAVVGVGDRACRLHAGQLVALPPAAPHAVLALDDAVLLVTVLLA